MPTHLLGPILAEAQAGRFSAALRRIQESEGAFSGSDTQSYRVLKAEMLGHTGLQEQAKELAETVLRSNGLHAALGSRCQAVVGGTLFDDGDLDEALESLQRSVRLAEESGDVEQLCWSQLRLMATLADVSSPESVVTLAADLRHNSARSGNPHIAAGLRIYQARIDAKRGALHNTKHNLSIATSLLRDAPNAWLEGILQLDLCVVSQIQADLDGAVGAARHAMECGEISGHLRTQAAALGNLGQLCLYQGDLRSSEDHLKRALRVSSSTRNVHLSLLDSYAQLKLTQGQLDECQELLEEIDRLNPPRDRYQPSWLDLWIHQTKIRLLLRREGWTEAADLASAAIEIAAAREDRLLGGLFRVLKADALAHLDRHVEAGQLLADASATCDSTSLDTSAEIERVRGVVLARQGQTHAAARHFDRAHRVADSIGNACLRMRIEADRGSNLPGDVAPARTTGVVRHHEPPNDRRPGGLEGVTLLLELASRPDLMGRELLHVLDREGYDGPCRLARRTEDGSLEPIASPASRSEAGVADDAGSPDAIEFPLDDDGVVLLVEPPRSFEATETLAAVRKLVQQARELERATQQKRRRASFWETEPAAPSLGGGVFVSKNMMDILATARQAAPTDIPILLTGETGTGKELLARAIHDSSSRAGRTFLPFDCNSVPRDLLDSQLFGHRRGAFTGATEQFPGVIRAAQGGTLFLDEIGELSPDVQPKLLRFLEAHHVHPLGASSPVPVDVRIVAATNADLDRLVSEGTFREDLYYRLNVIRLPLPPLRERREEIPPLAQHFLELHAEEQGHAPARLSDEALEYVLLHRWPGNVRELGNEMRRLVAFAEPGSIIGPELLSPHIRASRRTVPAEADRSTEAVQLSLRQPMASATDELERALIGHALTRTGGRLEPAARLLGLSRKGLYLKRQRLQLDG